MLKRQAPAVIPCSLTLKGQGETVKFNVNYHNRTPEQFEAKVKEPGIKLGNIALFLIESWESEYELTFEGLKEAEQDWPGLITGLIGNFHAARQVSLEKN